MLRTDTRNTTKRRARGVRACALLLLALALSALSVPSPAGAAGQTAWEKTPYQRWTKEDVRAILNGSPWGRLIEETHVVAPGMLGIGAPKVEVGVFIRLRSALPIRQALLRQRQLEQKYDAMSREQRAAFDAQNAALLECPACARYYVITVRSRGYALRHSGATEQALKRSYLANENGERRALANYVPPKEESDDAFFFFPRADDKGNPLLTPQSKKLIFLINIKSEGDMAPLPEKVEFDVTRLLRDGQVVF